VRHTIVVIYEGKKQNLNRYCIDLAEQYRLSEGKSIEFLEEHHLMFNIMRHELVPEHLLITDHEKAELLNKYKIKESQLPKILVSDPVSIFLGLRRGDVVKIVRKSETAGTYISYRAVV
jgi:DNA-directed RNA polymerases I, II, and III subunit RPABC1